VVNTFVFIASIFYVIFSLSTDNYFAACGWAMGVFWVLDNWSGK